MKVFTKKEKETPSGSSISRIAKLETAELYSWFNSTLMGLGRTFDSWRYEDGPDEVSTYLEILDEIWKEISRRKNDQRS